MLDKLKNIMEDIQVLGDEDLASDEVFASSMRRMADTREKKQRIVLGMWNKMGDEDFDAWFDAIVLEMVPEGSDRVDSLRTVQRSIEAIFQPVDVKSENPNF